MPDAATAPRRRRGPSLSAGARSALGNLVRELSSVPEWPQLQVDAVLMLYDVLLCLGYSVSSIVDILDPAGTRYLVARMKPIPYTVLDHGADDLPEPGDAAQ